MKTIIALGAFVLCAGAASAQTLLGVAEEGPKPAGPPAAAAPAIAVPETPEELRIALMRAQDDLKRAKQRLADLEDSIPRYAPGGTWDRHYRAELADAEMRLPFAEANVRKANSAWAKFRRAMNYDLVSGQITGHRDDWAAASRLTDAKKRVESARAQVNVHIPGDYKSMKDSRDQLLRDMPMIEAKAAAMEAKKKELNARGVKVNWDDVVPRG
jgi:hypothetical protein